MKILATNVYLGPNLYAHFRVIRHRVDVGILEEWPSTRLGDDFIDGRGGDDTFSYAALEDTPPLGVGDPGQLHTGIVPGAHGGSSTAGRPKVWRTVARASAACEDCLVTHLVGHEEGEAVVLDRQEQRAVERHEQRCGERRAGAEEPAREQVDEDLPALGAGEPAVPPERGDGPAVQCRVEPGHARDRIPRRGEHPPQLR